MGSGLSSPSSPIAFTCSLPLWAPAVLAFLLFHTHSKLLHASGPLSLLSLLPGKPSPQNFAWLPSNSTEPFPDHMFSNNLPFSSCCSPPLSYFSSEHLFPSNIITYIYLLFVVLPRNVNSMKARTLVLSRWVLNPYLLNKCV